MRLYYRDVAGGAYLVKLVEIVQYTNERHYNIMFKRKNGPWRAGEVIPTSSHWLVPVGGTLADFEKRDDPEYVDRTSINSYEVL